MCIKNEEFCIKNGEFCRGKHLDAQLKANSLSSKVQIVQAEFDKYSATVSRLLVPINKFVDLGRPVPLDMAREMHGCMMEGVRYVCWMLYVFVYTCRRLIDLSLCYMSLYIHAGD